VPGVIMNTWGDTWYHTSEDRANKIDPTQMKRCVIMGAAAAYTIAGAGDDMAVQIAAEIVSNSAKRIGHQLARGVEELKRTDAQNFPNTYKKVRGYIEAAAQNERATLGTVLELADDTKRVGGFIQTMKESVGDIEQGNLRTLDAHMKATAERLGVSPAALTLSGLEKKAAGTVPKPTAKIRENGYRGYQQFISRAMQEAGAQTPRRRLRAASEVQLLIDGVNSVLDIKKMVDTQFQQETDLQAIFDHLEILKAAGLIEL